MNRLPESQRRPPSSWSSDAKLEPLAVGGNVNPNKGGADLAKKAYRLAQAMAQEQEKASEVNDERLAGGGSPMIPAFERAEMIGLSRGNNHPPGFVGGTSPGRTDTINTNVPSGSYVLPSDIVSGLGQGNSQAGAAVIQKMLGTGPYGIPLKSMGHAGHGIPHPPAPFHEPTMQTPSAPSGFADGGGDKEAVPVKIAAGEFLIHPHHVRHIGGGDLDRGHALLDKFVLAVRKKSIEEQKKLPGPKQAHEV